GERFARCGIGRSPRRQNTQEGFRKRERLRRNGFQDRIQRLLLSGGIDDRGNDLAIVTKSVAVVQAPDLLSSGLGLIAVQEIKRNQGVLQIRNGCVGRNRILAETLQRRAAKCENAIEFRRGIRAVVPEMCMRMSAAQRARILIGDEIKPAGWSLLQNVIEGRMRIATRLELRVSVLDRYLVPSSDSGGISVRKIGATAGIQ